jgi:hypothetical protein
MADKYAHNNPQDPVKGRFVKMEEQVPSISRNTPLLIVSLESKLRSFREARGSNFEIGSEGKSRDNENPKKESRK